MPICAEEAHDTRFGFPLFNVWNSEIKQGNFLPIRLSGDWRVANDKQHQEFRITEILPVGQTLDAWQDMLTITIHRQGAKMGIDSFAQGIQVLMAGACENLTHTSLKHIHDEGETLAYSSQFCTLNRDSKQGEMVFIKFLYNGKDMITVQRAKKTPPNQFIFSETEVLQVENYLKNVKICKMSAGKDCLDNAPLGF